MKSILARTIKCGAIAALIGGAFLRSAPAYALLFQIVIVIAAVVVLSQAAKMRRYVWAALFLVVACLFNPVFPIPFSDYIFEIATTFAGFLFFFSLELLKPERSIIDDTPGGN